MDTTGVPLANAPHYAWVDAEDADMVLAHTWKLMDFNGKSIPVTRIDRKYVRLNRFVLGCRPGDGWQVVPKNGDYEDCRKDNLKRMVTALDPSKSWDRRRKRLNMEAVVPSYAEMTGCRHPVLMETDDRETYCCIMCKASISVPTPKSKYNPENPV